MSDVGTVLRSLMTKERIFSLSKIESPSTTLGERLKVCLTCLKKGMKRFWSATFASFVVSRRGSAEGI